MEKQYLFYDTRKGCLSAVFGGVITFILVVVAAIFFPDNSFFVGLSLFIASTLVVKISFDLDKKTRS